MNPPSSLEEENYCLLFKKFKSIKTNLTPKKSNYAPFNYFYAYIEYNLSIIYIINGGYLLQYRVQENLIDRVLW